MNTYLIQQPAPAPKKSNKTLIIVVIIVMFLCCLCTTLIIGGYYGYGYLQKNNIGIGDAFESNPTIPTENNSGEPAAPENAPEKPELQLPNLFGVALGDEVRCESCGFSFKKIPGYDYDDTWNIFTMSVPGADVSTGPVVVLVGGLNSNGMTLDEFKTLMASSEGDEITFTDQKNIRVGGVDGFSFNVETTEEGIAVKGRVVGALVTPNQVFAITGMAPTDKWAELSPYFDAVMKSVAFFEPVPEPTATVAP